MLHLILKDFYIQKKIAYFIPILLLPYFLTIGKNSSGSNPITLLIYSLSISFIAYFMATYSNFNTEENERNQNRLLLSLPITRQSVINAKYVMISIWWLISYISYVIILIILKNVFDHNIISLFDLRVIALSFCFTYLLMSFFYPLQYKFGFRVASTIGIAIFFIIPSGLGKLLSNIENTSFISLVIERPIVSVSIITIVSVLISYYLSVYFFTKKDL